MVQGYMPGWRQKALGRWYSQGSSPAAARSRCRGIEAGAAVVAGSAGWWSKGGGEKATSGNEVAEEGGGECKPGLGDIKQLVARKAGGWADGWPEAAHMKRQTIKQVRMRRMHVGSCAAAGGQTGNQMRWEGRPKARWWYRGQRPPHRAAAADGKPQAGRPQGGMQRPQVSTTGGAGCLYGALSAGGAAQAALPGVTRQWRPAEPLGRPTAI